MVTVSRGYDGSMRLAHDLPEWIEILSATYRVASSNDGRLCGRWVRNELLRSGWKGMTYGEGIALTFPGLGPLARRGILRQDGTSRGGDRAYYQLIDPDGVEQALRELGF